MDDPDGQPFGLAPIQLTDKPLFDAVYRDLAQPISDYSFANTFIWSTSLKLYWRAIDHHLCVFANGTGDLTMLMPPMPQRGATGGDLRSCLQASFDIMNTYNERVGAGRGRSRIEYVSDEMVERMSTLKGMSLAASPFSGDYVYDMRSMIDLEGKKLKSKRHARGRFMRQYPDHRTQSLSESHVPDCLRLLQLWQERGDAAHRGEITEEHVGSEVLRHRDTLACEMALKHFRALGMTGMSLFAGEQLIGFTLGEPISPTQASIIIEKTHPGFYGCAQYIFAEFCRQYWSDLPQCNVGDDWGIPSLRNVKASYRPIRLLSKNTITLKQPALVGAMGFDVPLPDDSHMCGHAAAAAEPVMLRCACPDDTGALVKLEQTCFSTREETLSRRQIRCFIANPRAAVTVAHRGSEVVGWAVGLVRRHRTMRSGRLYAVAVHPDLQGRGVGRRLVETTIESLRTEGIGHLFLEVRHDNAAAIGLYRRLGFTDHRFLPDYYSAGRHAIRMKLTVARQTLSTTMRQTVSK